MTNAMPVLNVSITMHNHDSNAGVIITRDGLVVTIRTIAQNASMLELMTMINWYRGINGHINEKVRVSVRRNKR